MNKVYLYSRVSTDQQTLAQQERTVYEWLNRNNMKVNVTVSDEGISGGVTYKQRNLGKVLLPKMQAGDMLIVSEISRLGRSMYDLSTLIHTELKPRKIRLVVVSMGVDLRCDKLTAMDELILNNFSFAAQLEKQLISERTLSALQVKKAQGIKLGGASEKYKQNYINKDKEVKMAEAKKRGQTKRNRFLASRDVTAFVKVLGRVFPQACTRNVNDPIDFTQINTQYQNRMKILQMMRDFKEMDADGALFAKWDLSGDLEDVSLQHKLANLMSAIKKSLATE